LRSIFPQPSVVNRTRDRPTVLRRPADRTAVVQGGLPGDRRTDGRVVYGHGAGRAHQHELRVLHLAGRRPAHGCEPARMHLRSWSNPIFLLLRRQSVVVGNCWRRAVNDGWDPDGTSDLPAIGPNCGGDRRADSVGCENLHPYLPAQRPFPRCQPPRRRWPTACSPITRISSISGRHETDSLRAATRGS